jgi:hypothetical protein
MKMRVGLLLCLALGAPACTWDDAGDRKIVVINNTASSIVVDVDAKYDRWTWDRRRDDLEVVPAGGVYSEKFPGADEVRVRITRTTDGLLLFHAKYDVDDFADEDGKIVISINP